MVLQMEVVMDMNDQTLDIQSMYVVHERGANILNQMQRLHLNVSMFDCN